MPRKPKHPCAYSGCKEFVDGRYCEKHAKVRNSQYEKYNRDPNTKCRYGRCWKRIRDSLKIRDTNQRKLLSGLHTLHVVQF